VRPVGHDDHSGVEEDEVTAAQPPGDAAGTGGEGDVVPPADAVREEGSQCMHAPKAAGALGTPAERLWTPPEA
jgi:hypothetical protein